MTSQKKILSLSALKVRVRQARARGQTIVFTNGCFDLLHLGHIAYLEKIKDDRSFVIVAVNSDRSVRAIKVKGRPIQPQMARARVVAALGCVDHVVIFNTKTPYAVIKAVQPDILVKGADWKGKTIVGEDVVRARGGQVVLAKYVEGFSTTNIIDRIRKRCAR